MTGHGPNLYEVQQVKHGRRYGWLCRVCGTTKEVTGRTPRADAVVEARQHCTTEHGRWRTTRRYVIHADYSPEQVYQQASWLNRDDKADWGLIVFINRDGSASVLLPETARMRAEGTQFRIFQNGTGIGYIQAFTKDVEVIDL